MSEKSPHGDIPVVEVRSSRSRMDPAPANEWVERIEQQDKQRAKDRGIAEGIPVTTE